MKSNIVYIILSFVLCFGFKAQAQNAKVVMLKDYSNTLQSAEKERLKYLIYGTPALLMLEAESSYLWNEGKNIETVDVLQKDVDLLTKSQYKGDFKNCQILILRLEEGDTFKLTAEHFKFFEKLKYVLVRYDVSFLRKNVENQLSDLKLEGQLNGLVFLLEPNDSTDEQL